MTFRDPLTLVRESEDARNRSCMLTKYHISFPPRAKFHIQDSTFIAFWESLSNRSGYALLREPPCFLYPKLYLLQSRKMGLCEDSGQCTPVKLVNSPDFGKFQMHNNLFNLARINLRKYGEDTSYMHYLRVFSKDRDVKKVDRSKPRIIRKDGVMTERP